MTTQNRIFKDRAGNTRYYSVEELGPNQSLTPEGFLLCLNVPIARTGTQLYHVSEVPIEDAGNGEVRVVRQEADVFRPETLASFEGKPVTIDHPDEFVTPGNWKQLAVGVVQNVRRGDGSDTDLLIADLLITDQTAIDAVRADKLRQVSCGYEAEYEQDMPGMGYQRNIVGNHVALVERGRAGPRVAIQDKETTMTKKASWIDKLRALLKDAEADETKKNEKSTEDDDGDEDETEGKKKPEAKTGDGAVLKAIDKLSKSVDALTKRVGDMEKPDDKGDKTGDDDGDDDDETTDAILAAETAGKANIGVTFLGKFTMGDAAAKAEILAPGISIPTGDSAKGPIAVLKLERAALKTALATDTGRAVIEPLLGGRELAKVGSESVHTIFLAASEAMKARNNDQSSALSRAKDFGKPTGIAAINQANQAFWARGNSK